MRILALLFIPFILSCSFFDEELDNNAIARVENKMLYHSDIKEIVSEV